VAESPSPGVVDRTVSLTFSGAAHGVSTVHEALLAVLDLWLVEAGAGANHHDVIDLAIEDLVQNLAPVRVLSAECRPASRHAHLRLRLDGNAFLSPSCVTRLDGCGLATQQSGSKTLGVVVPLCEIDTGRRRVG